MLLWTLSLRERVCVGAFFVVLGVVFVDYQLHIFLQNTQSCA